MNSPEREEVAKQVDKEYAIWCLPQKTLTMRDKMLYFHDALISREMRVRELLRNLATSRTRLKICLGRMAACSKEPQKHEVSLEEIPAWLEEMDDWLALNSKGEKG